MSNNMVWGIGGARFVLDNTTVDIPLAIGKLWFIDEAPSWTTKNKIFVKHTEKLRPMAAIQIPNVTQSDYVSLLALLNLLNMRSGLSYKTAIEVYPRLNIGTGIGLMYEMFCTSEYAISDVHPNGIAQFFPLTFKGKYTQANLPTLYGNMNTYNVTGNGDVNITGDDDTVLTGIL